MVSPTRLFRFRSLPEDSADPPRHRGEEAADGGSSPLRPRRPVRTAPRTGLRHGPEEGQDPAQRSGPLLALGGSTWGHVGRAREAEQPQVDKRLRGAPFALGGGHLGRCQVSRCPPLVLVQWLLRLPVTEPAVRGPTGTLDRSLATLRGALTSPHGPANIDVPPGRWNSWFTDYPKDTSLLGELFVNEAGGESSSWEEVERQMNIEFVF